MSKTSTNEPLTNSTLARIGHWITTLPRYGVDIPAVRRRQATLLQMVLVASVMSSVVAGLVLVLWVGGNSALLSESITLILCSCFVFVLAFGLNRAGHYASAATLLLLVAMLVPYIGGYMLFDEIPELHQVHWFSITSLLLVGFLIQNQRAIWLFGLLDIIAVVLLHVLIQQATAVDLFVPVTTIGMAAVCAAVFDSHRNKLEDERQVELIASNKLLTHQMEQREQLTSGLTAILQATDDLLTAPDLDNLWKRGVELARQRLKVERCAIYEYDSQTGEMVGTYGTNKAGVTVPEYANRFKIADTPWVSIAFTNKLEKPWAVEYDMALSEFSDNANRLVSKGWNAYTLISSTAGQPTAVMFNDCAISGRAFDSTHQDLIGVYCSLLGGIVERKRAEMQRAEQQLALEAANVQLQQQMRERARLTSGLTLILNSSEELLVAPSLDQLWRRGTELVREILGAERTAILEYDAATDILTGTYGTDLHGATIPEQTKRVNLSEEVWLAKAIAMKGGKPWVVQEDTDQHDFRDGKLVPVSKGWIAYTKISDRNGLPAAVLINDDAISGRPFDPIRQDLISVYCSLLGGIIERKRAELQREAQRDQLTTSLTAILNSTDELMVAPNLDQLWKRGTELAREILGLDRNSIFEYDAATQELIGTYGTDMNGATVAEHTKRFPITREPWIIGAIAKKNGRLWTVQDNVELHEYRNGVDAVVAHGWIGYTLISDRSGVPAAVMFNDNSISGQPHDPLKQDLVGLYCSLLGSIVERKRAEAQRDEQQALLVITNDKLQQQMEQRDQLTTNLTAILKSTDELLAAPDVDTLWKRAVELAHQHLTKDRNGIFRYEPETGNLVGTYGINMLGTTISERDHHFKISESVWADDPIDNKRDKPWAVVHDISLREFVDGEFRNVGTGWAAMTSITYRDGQPAALFLNDNAMTGKPFDPLRQDLIGIFCSLLSGIIERKHAEAQLEENIKELKVAKRMADESSRIKSEFLATVSHELRTPLNAIIGFSDMLLMGMSGELSSKQQHKMVRLRENGVRLLTLINNVLDLTRLEARRVEIINKPFSPQMLVKRIAAQTEVLAQQKNLNFLTTVDPETPTSLNGDEQRIEQVVVNLLSNAFKFTEAGSVTLTVRPDTKNNAWQVIVADTGIGIPPHALNMIFEEFRQVDGSFSRTYKGTGLGLAITRNLIRLMHGEVQVSSEMGKGSVFTVTLPIVEKTSDLLSAIATAPAQQAPVQVPAIVEAQ